MDLVLTRMHDKYKNQTEVFRFMDAKGKGKVKRQDFLQAVEKMRISLSREDVTKVFQKIDSNGIGHFTYQDLAAASMKNVNLDARQKVAMG